MIDLKTLELIKNNQFSESVNFPEELHQLIHSFYAGFDLDRQDSKYREDYIRHFIEQHEGFIVNYETNVFNANISTSDKLSDELTFNKFLDTLASYLTKYYEDENRG
jgi:hypothetical protein